MGHMDSIPKVGVGIGLRAPHVAEVLASVNVFEVNLDFVGAAAPYAIGEQAGVFAQPEDGRADAVVRAHRIGIDENLIFA